MTPGEVNHRALLKRFPNIADKLSTASELNSPLEFLPTPSGDLTVKGPKGYYYSSYRPLQDVKRTVEAIVSQQSQLDYVIVGGWGLGYHTQFLLEMLPQMPILLWEPSSERFFQALEKVDQSQALSHPHLSLILEEGPEALNSFQSYFARHRFLYLPLATLNLENPALFHNGQRVLEQWRNTHEINQRTLFRFYPLWAKNFFQNLASNPCYRGVQELKGCAKGLPLVLCAAGPSLQEQIPLLIQYRKRFILMAVDTALRPLLNHDLIPDILVSMDGQYWNSRHLDPGLPPSTLLISELISHTKIHRLGQERHFVCGSTVPFLRVLEQELSPPPLSLASGGSVATTAWEVAFLMESSPLILCGLDLAYPRGQTHSRGSLFEERQVSQAYRFSPLESYSLQLRTSGGRLVVPSNDKETVETDQRMDVYRRWFEYQRTLRPSDQIWNTSPSGACIQGLPFAELAFVLQALPEMESHTISIRVDSSKPESRIPSNLWHKWGESLGTLIQRPHEIKGIWAQWKKLWMESYLKQICTFPWTEDAEYEKNLNEEFQQLLCVFLEAWKKSNKNRPTHKN